MLLGCGGRDGLFKITIAGSYTHSTCAVVGRGGVEDGDFLLNALILFLSGIA